MAFVSPIFLFVFLPAFLAIYYFLLARFRSACIVVGSSIFYAWWRLDFLFLIYAIILWSWLFGFWIDRYRDNATWLLSVAIAGDVLTLVYFKYFNFGIDTLQALIGDSSLSGIAPVILPIGISFFVFHAISYVVDIKRRDTEPARNLIDFAAFITLFPHMIAGPILKFKDMAAQFKTREHNLSLFSEGAYRFMVGSSQKILIADTIAPLADSVLAAQSPTMVEAWLGAFAYSLQLFFDFAGYSNMAIGLALMMGFRFIENFNAPYLARSITDFWRRWHISLSTWLRDYIYIPLGGNRKGKARACVNVLVTMALGGLWHGAGWTYLLWGIWHGLLLAVGKWSGKTTHFIPLTFLAVMLGWVLFRSADLSAAVDFYAAMGGAHGFGLSDDFAWQIQGTSIMALCAGTALVFLMSLTHKYSKIIELSKNNFAFQKTIPLGLQIVMTIVFILAVSRMIALNYSPFLYFQF